MADDEAIYSNNDITITKALAKFGGASYPINTIASVYVAKPQTLGAWLFGGLMTFVGLAMLLMGKEFSLTPGIFPLALGLFVFWMTWRAKYSLMLKTAAGSNQAYSSRNRAYLHEVKAAIEEAITVRG